MKPWKKAATGIFLLLLMLASWHVVTSREAAEFEDGLPAVGQGLSGFADKVIAHFHLPEPETEEYHRLTEERVESECFQCEARIYSSF